MASMRRNISYQNKKQEATEIAEDGHVAKSNMVYSNHLVESFRSGYEQVPYQYLKRRRSVHKAAIVAFKSYGLDNVPETSAEITGLKNLLTVKTFTTVRMFLTAPSGPMGSSSQQVVHVKNSSSTFDSYRLRIARSLIDGGIECTGGLNGIDGVGLLDGEEVGSISVGRCVFRLAVLKRRRMTSAADTFNYEDVPVRRKPVPRRHSPYMRPSLNNHPAPRSSPTMGGHLRTP
ncbi:hypothetical protein AAG570_011103 [Ranatra chinensis]|uniref:Uncharacterized protein n=1 Tax=Ranatra chinensis TaxID=642074 RepID=A0ABD0YJM5_9HEMI